MGPPCTVIFILAAVALSYLYITSHSRYRVTGKVDPVTGYQIEYTVSSRYRSLSMSDPQTMKANHQLEYWTYMPTPMIWPVRWYYTFIMRRSDAATEPDENADMGGALKAHEIQQITFLGKTPEGHRIDPNGFVKPGDIAGVGEYVTQEQSVISNCAATWYSFDRTNLNAGAGPMRYYNLYIHPKGRPITFMFSGISDSGEEPNDVLDEMSNIRDSIRIIKTN
jgi:hypothetical protein